MSFPSGRTKGQFIRIAVIEGNNIYVTPQQYDLLQRISYNTDLIEAEKARAIANVLALTESECQCARYRQLNIIVDRDLRE
jgi:hypothetical protein